jgi:hypothetical protein
MESRFQTLQTGAPLHEQVPHNRRFPPRSAVMRDPLTFPTDEQYLAYRRRVSDGIRKVQREERIIRIAMKSAWAVTGVVFLIDGTLDFNLERTPGSPGDWVRLSLIFPTLVCLACSTALLAGLKFGKTE